MTSFPHAAHRRPRRPFVAGVLVGVLALLAGRWAINESTIPDRLLAPLLVPDTAGTADVLVVLGAGVVGDCGVNLNGVRRVLLAAQLYKAGRAPQVVFTGASGEEACPVALAMGRLAGEVGIPAASMHLETASRSTRENAELTAPLLRRLGARRLIVVTDRLHMRRASASFEQLGYEVGRASVPIYEGHVDNVSMLAAGLREVAALVYYRLRGWAETGSPAALAAAVPAAEGVESMTVSNPQGPIVLLGASYAGGWSELTEVAGIPVINRGVPGQQSFEMLERFERDVVAERPRAVLLWGFINDIFRAPGDLAAASQRARESYREMLTLARRHGIEPILATEVTIRPERSWLNPLLALLGAVRGKTSYQDRINGEVRATNAWLVDLARREGLLLLDLQSTLAGEGGQRRSRFALDDGSHISPAGYAALTRYAGPLLARHFSGRDGSPAE